MASPLAVTASGVPTTRRPEGAVTLAEMHSICDADDSRCLWAAAMM